METVKTEKQPTCSGFTYSMMVEYSNKDARNLASVMNSVIHTLFTYRFALAKKCIKAEPVFHEKIIYVSSLLSARVNI